MKIFKTLVAIFTLGTVGSAGASTIFDVTYTPQSLNFLGSTAPLSGAGTGTAILNDDGLLSINLQGELMADASAIGFGPGSYMDIFIGSTFQIMTTSSGDGSFSPITALGAYPVTSNYSQITSCGYGALETIFLECGSVNLSKQYVIGPSPDGYPYNFYSDQSFTLNGGSLNIQTSLFSSSAVSFLAALELTPAQSVEPEPPVIVDPEPPVVTDPEPPIVAAVPEPYSVALLLPGLITLTTFGRRKAKAA